MSKVDLFQEVYKNLNPAQKAAVDSIEGPVMVIAGPGTGKTQILTLRIANILLQTQVNPENILALTFTESGVLAMRKRLASIIGTPAYKVDITTFHTFCNEIIHRFPEDFPHLISSNSITEIEQIQLIEEIISKESLDILKPFGDPLYYLKLALQSVNDLKKEGVSIDSFQSGISSLEKSLDQAEDLYHEKGAFRGQKKAKYIELERDIQKNKELLLIYQKYQEKLIEEKQYDFNDMLMEVVNAFTKNPTLLLQVQELYQYILVDEHQDTNTAQNKLIEYLCNFYDNPNLFIVGDEKQAIYRFQGASIENFLYFKKLYPEAILINLEETYRSTQTILDGAGSLISHNVGQFLPDRVRLKSNRDFPEEKIRVAILNDYFAELCFLARDIKQKVAAGVPLYEIAVLARNNRDLSSLSFVLEQEGVKFNIEADQNILTDQTIRKFLLLLRAIENYGDDHDLVVTLHSDFLGIEPLDLYKIMQLSRSSKLKVCDILEKVETLSSLDLSQPERLINFYKLLKSWKIASQNENLENLFVQILNESTLLDYILKKSNSMEIIDKVTGLFEEVKIKVFRNPRYSLKDFLSYLDLLQSHDLLIKKSAKTVLPNAVRLMTAHKSKGLEFEYVYIMSSFNGHWGNLKRRNKGLPLPWEELGVKLKIAEKIDEIEDERRLFYVALTRAEKEVTISLSTRSLEGKEQLPSQFIDDIDSEYKTILSLEEFEQEFLAHKEGIFKTTVSSISPQKNISFVRDLFHERGLSVSGLNNYLKCPWSFFYRNLLLLPEKKAKAQMYGSAVHQSLNKYIQALNQGKETNTLLIESFIQALADQPLNEKDFQELTVKGQKTLQNYFEQKVKYWTKDILSEVKIRGVKLNEDIVLNGAIDMIEKQEGNLVNVYDFKTGRPRTRGEIEGTTASSNGDYKRQLVFYKLLVDRFYQDKMKVKMGIIDFLEADLNGKVKSESFEITSEEVSSLEKEILRVSDEIMNLSFWGSHCDDSKCEYCAYRTLMSD